jgi:hypothetical protein
MALLQVQRSDWLHAQVFITLVPGAVCMTAAQPTWKLWK